MTDMITSTSFTFFLLSPNLGKRERDHKEGREERENGLRLGSLSQKLKTKPNQTRLLTFE